MSLIPSYSRERLQPLVIASGAAGYKGTTMLMATAMAVYIGRDGSPFAVSLVSTVFFFGLMVFSPVWGALADITGRRREVLLGTGALATLSIVPLSFVDGVWGPLGLRGLFAVFAAGFLPVMFTIVAERGGSQARGRSIGLFSAAQAVGFILGQFFAGVLLGLVARWSLYLIVAAFSVIVVGAALLTEDPTPNPDREVTRAEVFSEIKQRLLPAAADRQHLRSNGLKWLYVAILLRNMTVIGTSSLLPIYLVARVDVSEFLMGAILAVNPAGQMAFMYVAGRLSDRLGRKPLILIGMAGSGLHALVLAGAVLPANPLYRGVVAGAGMLVLAAGFSALTTGSIAFIGDVAPTSRESELIGLRSTARGLGGVLGPMLFGTGAMVFGYEATFAAGSLLAFVGAGLVSGTLVESYGGVPAASD